MSVLSGKNVLIIIPKSQHCGWELVGVRSVMEYEGARVVVLSRSGQEGRGMDQERFQPDGMIIDWNKQPGEEESARNELEGLGIAYSDFPVTCCGNIVAGQGADAAKIFARTVGDLLSEKKPS